MRDSSRLEHLGAVGVRSLSEFLEHGRRGGELGESCLPAEVVSHDNRAFHDSPATKRRVAVVPAPRSFAGMGPSRERMKVPGHLFTNDEPPRGEVCPACGR